LHEREKRGLFSYSMLGIIGRGKNILDVHMGTHTHTHTQDFGGSMVIRFTMKLQNTYNKLKIQLTLLWRCNILLNVEFYTILF